MDNQNQTLDEIVMKIRKHTTLQLQEISVASLLEPFKGQQFFIEVLTEDIEQENNQYKLTGYVKLQGITKIHAYFPLIEKEQLLKIDVHDNVVMTGFLSRAEDTRTYIFENCMVINSNKK
ncbi:hypothetical protein [Niallia endozanthoxylica]|uniref:Uncharacterized protein n=1 Tax=Niallia endozanthoxylica TaxID=2036016 RepID=A0A5J5HHS1_9BACI|nr:hypothetical protein [Niallia endozanthoxylica]KAA9019478.1 hypothetical protein F4V44_19200 [Niallia endozanthoxylica]